MGTKSENIGKLGTHDVEVEVLGDPVSALLEFVVETHDVQGVQAVDDGRTEIRDAEDTGAVTSLRDRSQLVLSPGVPHVVVPAMFHHLREENEHGQIKQLEINYTDIREFIVRGLQGICGSSFSFNKFNKD